MVMKFHICLLGNLFCLLNGVDVLNRLLSGPNGVGDIAEVDQGDGKKYR
jgi:hypothetical protein